MHRPMYNQHSPFGQIIDYVTTENAAIMLAAICLDLKIVIVLMNRKNSTMLTSKIFRPLLMTATLIYRFEFRIFTQTLSLLCTFTAGSH